MLKKIFFIILSLNLLNNCDYKPVYSSQNKIDYKIVIANFSGDKDVSIEKQALKNFFPLNPIESDS